jgi:hypothetical protein
MSEIPIEDAKELYNSYHRALELGHEVEILGLVARSPRSVTPGGADLETRVSLAEQKAKSLGLDMGNFEERLAKYVSSCKADEENPPRDIFVMVDAYSKEIEQKISEIRSGPEKAIAYLQSLIEVGAFSESDQVYEAIVLLDPDIPESLVAEIITDWKKERQTYRAEHNGSPFLYEDDIFWISLDFCEDYDGMSRYLFQEHFNIGGFESAFADVESMMANSLLESEPMMMVTGDTHLASVAHALWLIGRSQRMPTRIRDAVNLGLRRIAYQQYADGSWSDYRIQEPAGEDAKTGLKLSRGRRSIHTTALCALALCKLSISDEQFSAGVRGAKWLLDQQDPAGYWNDEYVDGEELKTKPSLLTTVRAVEAIIRSEIEGVEHAIEAGLAWVVGQQDELGTWDVPGIPYPLTTITVLQLTALYDAHAVFSDPLLVMAKGMLQQSYQLSLVDNINTARLSVIAAYHGLEAFLYSVLSNPPVNMSYFDKKRPMMTIGFRAALDELEAYLHAVGALAAGQSIEQRANLDQLANYRDQIVHKCIPIPQATCSILIGSAWDFARVNSVRMRGFDFLAVT